MDADVRKIAAEAGLEEGARRRIEAAAGRTQDCVDSAVRGRSRRSGAGRFTCDRLLVAAMIAGLVFVFAGTCGRGYACMGAHDASGHRIRFLLFRVPRLADFEFRVDGAAAQPMLHGLIPGLVLQLKRGVQRRPSPFGALAPRLDRGSMMVDSVFHI
ncbi:MAG TPA: hypothetical protein VMG40_15795 [Bryobacteraceae bacterium]|nr:hypothetical protein [Bryobacteraceae bacterium]